MRRAWVLIAAAGAMLVVLVAVALVVLAFGLKPLATTAIRSATGRHVSIDEAGLNLFTRRLTVKGLMIADRDGSREAFVELERLEVRFRLIPLLRGRLHIDAIELAAPAVRIVRLGASELNVSDLVERYLGGPSGGGPIALALDRLTLTGGALVFEDRAASPPRAFDVKGLTVELRDVSMTSDAKRGAASLTATLAGAPVSLRAEEIRASPAHARATLTVSSLDLAPFFPYAAPGVALRPERGRLTTRLELWHDATAGTRISGDVALSDVAVGRAGQPDAVVSTPMLSVTARDLVYADGRIAAGRLALETDLSILDQSLRPARRLDLRSVRVVVENASYPTGPPAGITLAARLPNDGTLDARGTVELTPLRAALDVVLAGLDLALARPYLPVSPVTLDHGGLGATLAVVYASGSGLRVNGELTATNLTLGRPGQTEPFVAHPRLRLAVTDLALQDGTLAIRRLALSGRPTIVDATVSPPVRAELSALSMVAEDVTWPAQRPARVQVAVAVRGSGTGSIEGTFNPSTLAADVRAILADVDLTRANPYLPADAPLALGHGRLSAATRLTYESAAGLRLRGDGAIQDLALIRAGERVPLLTDQRLTFRLDDVLMKDGALGVRKLSLASAPILTDGTLTPARTLRLRGLRLAISDVAYPTGSPARVELAADLPEAGALAVLGSVAPDTRTLDLTVDVREAALGPYQSWLPIDAPLRGTVDAALSVVATRGEALDLRVTGNAGARGVALGSGDRPTVTITRVEANGIAAAWPTRVGIDRLTIAVPTVLLERASDGSFPLRAMLVPPVREAAPASPAATPSQPPAPVAPGAPKPSTSVWVGHVALEDGDIRLVDHSTTPAYSEEISRLALRVSGFGTAPDARADVAVQGIVGATAAFDLAGQIAPFAQPFFLDLAGELRDFQLPRTNPFFRKLFAWFMKRGSLTTKVHYRILGDQLEASNSVHIERLGVERDRSATDAAQKIGLPLGLIVAIATDARGSIEFDVPVQGKLGSPEFSFGSAVLAALKHALVNLVTGPFRAIGKVFSKREEFEEPRVDPVKFEPGGATVIPEADQHLQRVADFLRASPHVTLTLRPVVSAGDLASLRTREVTARIQQVQRERGLADFTAAASRLFTDMHPDRRPPKTADEIVEILREALPVPEEAARLLAERRVNGTREALTGRAGIEGERLRASAPAVPLGAEGDGRVELELDEAP